MEVKKSKTNCIDCGVELEFKYKGNPPKRCPDCDAKAKKARQRKLQLDTFEKKLAQEKALKNQ